MGAVKITVVKDDNRITLVEEVNKFVVPAKVKYGSVTYDVREVQLHAQCLINGKFSGAFSLHIKSERIYYNLNALMSTSDGLRLGGHGVEPCTTRQLLTCR